MEIKKKLQYCAIVNKSAVIVIIIIIIIILQSSILMFYAVLITEIFDLSYGQPDL